jgi:NAD-dependent dihydropyrimidine dehydrogenase PreA subunit
MARCNLCQQACPYDVIYMNDELGIAQKCTGCAHRVDAGDLPRCAEVCPHSAIAFTEETGSAIDSSDDNRRLEIYHPEYQTKPRVFWQGLPKPWIAGTVVRLPGFPGDRRHRRRSGLGRYRSKASMIPGFALFPSRLAGGPVVEA